MDYFSTYLKKNSDKATENPALQASLGPIAELKKIATKPDPVAADVDAVQKNTAAILKAFQAVGGKP